MEGINFSELISKGERVPDPKKVKVRMKDNFWTFKTTYIKGEEYEIPESTYRMWSTMNLVELRREEQ